ncbi:glutamine-synthetase adenylyltransferase [Cognatishimia maritima]|uniref:Glutamate-ammonia-ligase adenylyltransferase n=1 Tax=Cognatishimia maritima TaxID=870908 RepID=A0A1M5IZT5_9RHOB|nr:glutamine-synthetase adenylyltransferase [Cognatishimia maritima]SHG33791.1 glutamate-ammonia-ligase adenylyltransferase [Cognatishimia maritima]
MNFTSRITRMPSVFDPEIAQDLRAQLGFAEGDIENLLVAVGSCSPYLRGLIQKEINWLPEALDAPEAALSRVHSNLSACPPDALGVMLRQAKRRIALMTALADIAGVWTLEDVTSALTDFADLSCQIALQSTVDKEITRGKLPGATEDDVPTLGGLVALAMGKMGAHELNYSSDIDLICLFDESQYELADFHDARSSLVRATRRAMALLSDITGEGYVFRTDLRLRPDPAVTPVCVAMEAAERYYESLGRTWERAAYIKARPAAGDLEAGNRFLDTLRPFVWRKHLDFATIHEAHEMRLRIREHKGLAAQRGLAGHNLKLGRGGIREIEFFAQTRQLIAGGRDRSLRMRQTVPALQRLAEQGWVKPDIAEKLSVHYRAHREVEHRIQMLNDAQTHDLPKTEEGLQRIACLMGRDLADLKDEWRARIDDVHALTEDFFAPDAMTPQPKVEAHKFDEQILSRWQTYPALRSSRAVEIFNRLKPDLLHRLTEAAKPDEALVALDGFLAGLPAGVQVFSLFEANPQLVDLLVDILSTSPALAQYLSRNSSVLDAVIGGAFFAAWPGKETLCSELQDLLDANDDYESCLDAARRWMKEYHFRIGVHHLRGLISATEAATQYSELAETILVGLWPVVTREFANKHGAMPGRGAMVLGMGSLGAGLLTATSDLDLIVIYDAAGVDASDGKRPLASRAYYARLTQALVTALSAPMAEGRLYEVDMRLRPSGTQGPVATSLTSFRDYQENQAWTWEHLALTRARPIAGAEDLMSEVELFRQTQLARPSDEAKVRADVQEMRERIASAKASSGVWDAKLGAGRLQDIELLSQTAALLAGVATREVGDSLRNGALIGWLDEEDVTVLRDGYDLFRTLQSVARLLGQKALNPDELGAGGVAFLLRETEESSVDTLRQRLEQVAENVGARIDRSLARPLKG